MLKQLKKPKLEKPDQGFTIIEVMIVLAIAGLILLIVFLAVPALQRSSRNTQRKNDIGSLATGISNFESNNSGAAPTGATIASGVVTLTGGGGTSSNADIKFGYYTAAPTVVACGVTSGTCTGATFGFGPYQHRSQLAKLLFPSAAAAAPAVGPDQIAIVTGATCNGNSAAGSSSSRNYAIMYELEQSGSTGTTGGVSQCQGS